jgi:hypothetical protein
MFPAFPSWMCARKASTPIPTIPAVLAGRYQYWERIQSQGYTNQGQLFGDWIGREARAGQGWITYHLSGNEWVQASVRTQKAAKDFIPGGTTLNDFSVQAVKRIRKDFEIDGSFYAGALESPRLPPRLADCNLHNHPTDLVSGTQDWLLKSRRRFDPAN